MAIDKVFPKAPSDIIYNVIALLQKWSPRLKEGSGAYTEDEGCCVQLAQDVCSKPSLSDGCGRELVF